MTPALKKGKRELTTRAWAKGVQVMKEGLGHVSMHLIGENRRAHAPRVFIEATRFNLRLTN